MRILITGGAGFLGSHLSDLLIAHDVNKHKKAKPKAPEPQPAESAAAAEDEPEPEYVEQPVLARRRADEGGGPAAWQPV